MRDNLLINLALIFIPLSLTSIGGGAAIIAGAQVQTVEVYRWISEPEFVHLFAISRAAPGPGTMLATAVGWEVAGWSGALVATLALFLPSSLLCYIVFRATNAHREKPWHRIMREGLAPVGTGLIMAGTISLFRISGGGLLAAVTACASCLLLYLVPRFPVVAVLLLGGLAAIATATFSG
ncbi:chromate transporter [Rhizobium sp. NFR07]|uniref:chromate transporter n=1 Tax=Rhizobium sp. NFR07 TaxID=1566262 RepID=UPI0008EFFB59|nr:chromate transporter [Rhizobium sp. NFR07]SFA74451.1 chromate transporter [Rhizobium sp. NFR07]